MLHRPFRPRLRSTTSLLTLVSCLPFAAAGVVAGSSATAAGVVRAGAITADWSI
jgi:hypothetical protein